MDAYFDFYLKYKPLKAHYFNHRFIAWYTKMVLI